MATMPVIDALDRCKIALQYLAERQSDRLTIVLELLVERLEDAIRQAHAQLRQCTCAGSAPPQATRGSGRRGVLTRLTGSRQTTPPPAPMGLQAQSPDFLRLAEYGAMFQEE